MSLVKTSCAAFRTLIARRYRVRRFAMRTTIVTRSREVTFLKFRAPIRNLGARFWYATHGHVLLGCRPPWTSPRCALVYPIQRTPTCQQWIGLPESSRIWESREPHNLVEIAEACRREADAYSYDATRDRSRWLRVTPVAIAPARIQFISSTHMHLTAISRLEPRGEGSSRQS